MRYMLAPIMVIGKETAIRRAMKKADLSELGLADKMGCSHQTIKNILAGLPMADGTQRALHAALGDHSPGAKRLFEVDLGDGV